jgi:hypothetical protein
MVAVNGLLNRRRSGSGVRKPELRCAHRSSGSPSVVGSLDHVWSGWKDSFCPPTDASYMSPPSAIVTMATPLR